MMNRAFVLLFVLVASHSCTSGNTDQQEESEFKIDSSSMNFSIMVADASENFYQYLTTDSSFEIIDHDGICAIKYLGKKSYKGLMVNDIWRTMQVVYKIDSMLRTDYDFKLKENKRR